MKIKKSVEYISCCNDCGVKRYKIIRDAGVITISLDKCKLCGEQKGIVPARDWMYMTGITNEWD